MVQETVINFDFFQRSRPAIADHFNPVKLLFIFGSVLYLIYYYFLQKWGRRGAMPPRPLPPARLPDMCKTQEVKDYTNLCSVCCLR